MSPTEIPTVLVGPSSPIGDQSWAHRVHRLAQRPSQSSCTPSYYLGRAAETWLAALAPRHPSTTAVDRKAA